MKVAVIGGGPLGIEVAAHFQNLDAEVVLFTKNELGGSVRRLKNAFPEYCLGNLDEITTEFGRKLSSKLQCTRLKSYFENYLTPLIHWANKNLNVYSQEVLQVSKKFISPMDDEKRLNDLFRVVVPYKDHLQTYYDFDIVIMATGLLNYPVSLGGSLQKVLGEEYYEDKISQGYNLLNPLGKKIALIGSGTSAASILWYKREDIFNDKSLIMVTRDKTLFENVEEDLKNKALSVLDEMSKRDRQKEHDRERKIEENFGKFFPHVEKSFHLYTEFQVLGIDQLENHDDTFLSLEKIWGNEIKTHSVDTILNACGYKIPTNLTNGLRVNWSWNQKALSQGVCIHPEPGLYTVGPIQGDRYLLKDGLEQIKIIERDVMNYFSRGPK